MVVVVRWVGRSAHLGTTDGWTYTDAGAFAHLDRGGAGGGGVAATTRWMGGGGGVDDDDDGATRSETRDATYTIRMCVRVCVCERACLAELFEADYVRVRHNGHVCVCVCVGLNGSACFLTLRTRVAASLV